MDRMRYQWMVIVGLLFLALFVLETVPRVSGVTSPFQYLAGWVGRGFYVTVTTLQDGVARAVFGADGKTRIAELEYRVQLLATDKERLANLEAENRHFREALAFIESNNDDSRMARVIGHDPNDPQTRLRINIGTSSGVVEGAAATTSTGVLVGVVVEATERLSTIQLLKHPSLTIPVRSPSRINTFGLLESPDGFSLHVTQVPKDGQLVEGDVLVTNNGFRRVPPNLSVGVVGKVIENPETLWQQAQVVPYVDVRSLDYLVIVQTP